MPTGHSWINTEYLLLHYKCILKCCTAILSCWAEVSNKSGLVERLWNNKNNNREPCSLSLGLEWITCCYTWDQTAEKGKLTTLQEVSSWSPHFLYLCNQFGWNSLQKVQGRRLPPHSSDCPMPTDKSWGTPCRSPALLALCLMLNCGYGAFSEPLYFEQKWFWFTQLLK